MTDAAKKLRAAGADSVAYLGFGIAINAFNRACEEMAWDPLRIATVGRSEEHTSELQSLMRISYAVFCLKKKTKHPPSHIIQHNTCYIATTRLSVLSDLAYTD